MENKILVTGSSGLVGKAFQEQAKHYPKLNFVFINSKICDLTNYNKTNTYFKKINPQWIIHLAADVGGLYKNMRQKVKMLENNLLINFNVIRCAHNNNINNIISCLSTCIFPDKIKYPINENDLHEGPPHNSNYPYAYSKRLLEIHSRTYREQYGRNYSCIIPTNIYGKHDNFSLENGHVIPSLIHRCYLAKKNNEDLKIRGTGGAYRQFINSIDIANITLEIISKKIPIKNVIISVNVSDEVTIKTLVKYIANAFNFKNKIIYDDIYSDGQIKKTVLNDKLISKINNYKFINLDEGIKNTIKWFIKNYENCRK